MDSHDKIASLERENQRLRQQVQRLEKELREAQMALVHEECRRLARCR
jgi:cell division protein FtsB